jgi:hypothetical protein
VVQEVVLDKGVKIVDCPGVVLEDVAREQSGEEGRKRQAEIMLRNCIKAELVEDPISPGKSEVSAHDVFDTDFQSRLFCQRWIRHYCRSCTESLPTTTSVIS